jgi:hypothetical protein
MVVYTQEVRGMAGTAADDEGEQARGLIEEIATKEMRARNKQELKGVRRNGDRKAKEGRADGGGINYRYVDGDEDGNLDVESTLPTDEKHEREARPHVEVAAKNRERTGRLKSEQAAKANRANNRKEKGLGGPARTPLTKVWVQRREATTSMFVVSDETTSAEFRAQLSHRWPSDRHDEQPWVRWVATEVYKEGSMEGINIDDSLTMAEADIREDEQLEVVWSRVEEARRTLEKALEKVDWEERHNTIRRGRNTTVMIGRQREQRRAYLEGQMARLLQPVDKSGLCLVRMLAGDSEARLYKVHIVDIAHPCRMLMARDGTFVRGSKGAGRGGGILRERGTRSVHGGGDSESKRGSEGGTKGSSSGTGGNSRGAIDPNIL